MRRARFLDVVALFLLAGCASGGGGSGGTPVPSAFTIGPPATPFLPVEPTATGASLKNGAPPTAGTQFGLSQTLYSIGPNGLVGLSGAGGDGPNDASVIYTGSGYQFLIPARNVTLNVTEGENTETSSDGSKIAVQLELGTYILNGFWVYGSPNGGAFSTFEAGFVSPISSVPFTGSATYTSSGGVAAAVQSVINGSYEAVPVVGDASLNVNFATDQITGLFSNMVATNSANKSSAWNNVSITATLSGVRFNGSTQANSAPNTTYSLQANATGFINGWLYGPQATEIGALWSLYDGTFAATGYVTADGNPAPPPVAVTPPSAANLFMNPNPRPNVATISNPPTLAAPAPASLGTSPAAPVLASPGGPSLSGTPAFPATGTVFPLTQSVVQLSNAGLTVDASANAGGATLTIGPFGSSNNLTDFQLSIPSLTISQYIQLGGPLAQTIGGGSFSTSNGYVALEGLSYTSFGMWVATSANGQSDIAAFSLGYQTPAASVPTSGTATYAGTGNVVGNVYTPGNFGNTAPAVQGDASFTANFSTGQMTGTFSNMQAYAKSNPNSPTSVYAYPWNDVSVSASIASGTAKFSGSAVTTSQPASPLALKNGAMGYINGAFYGPNAENLSAVWSLGNGDGSGTALGVVGATKQ